MEIQDEPIVPGSHKSDINSVSIINALFTNGHIAQMTYKWLSFGQNHQEYQRFTR